MKKKSLSQSQALGLHTVLVNRMFRWENAF